jgi:uncharacterized membrane protein YfcA
MPVSPIELLLAVVVVAAGSLTQGSIGVGLGILTVPILSLINPIMAPVPTLLLAIPLTMSMALRERTAIEGKGVIWLLLGRFPGALLGLALLAVATQRTLDIWIALSVIVAVVILSTGVKVPRNPGTELGTGLVAGVMGMVASMGGPPAALLFKDAKGPTVRSTLALFFTFGLLVTLAARIVAGQITGDDVLLAAWMLPGLAIGYVASSRLRGRVDAMALRPAILVISSIAAVGLLLRALIG